MRKDILEQIQASKADVLLMCDVAYGDTDDELIRMAKAIKDVCASGKIVYVIPFEEETKE